MWLNLKEFKVNERTEKKKERIQLKKKKEKKKYGSIPLSTGVNVKYFR